MDTVRTVSDPFALLAATFYVVAPRIVAYNLIKKHNGMYAVPNEKPTEKAPPSDTPSPSGESAPAYNAPDTITNLLNKDE
jgi:hypothetical protein